MNTEIEWFCYYVVEDGQLTEEQCRAVASAIEQAEEADMDLATFAQTVIDNKLCTDVETLQYLMECAQEAAESMTQPPRWIINSEESVEQTTENEEQMAGKTVDETAEKTSAEPDTGGEDAAQTSETGRGHAEPEQEQSSVKVLQQWPDAIKAAKMETEEARKLMNELLAQARKAGCSDLHLSAGAKPFVRYNTEIHRLSDQDILPHKAAENLNLSIVNDENRETFDNSGDLDICYETSDGGRYRSNLHRQRLGVSGSYRIVDSEVSSLSELGFPRTDVLEKLTTYHQGLILITGPAGCGKSTTMNAFVDMLNSARREHIVTVEDPIEYVHQPNQCNITQREVGHDTENFPKALRAALREDPDIIVIGELRDLETIEMAIRASETGHLVLGTLHTLSAASTMDRILDVFPPEQQGQIKSMVSENLKGVICQNLLLNKDETGVVLASEIMLGTLAIANIIRDGETFKLPSTIQTNYNIGMRTLDQSIFDLYTEGKLTYAQAKDQIESEQLIERMHTNENEQEPQKATDKGKKKRGWFK